MKYSPKCTVIIPTRERAETLFYTIKTALNQASRDYEIVISDNFSQDNTREVVSNFHDDRIRYVNPGERLSMTDHWNFAVKQARGDYIIIIGDDDALMPGAIDRFIHELAEHPSKIYSWPTHVYFWPMDEDSAKIHHLAEKQPVSTIDLKEKIEFVTKYGLCNYLPLPHLYHSAVHKSILENIYLRTGCYFKTSTPDVYMSYVLPVFEDLSVNLGESITVVGHSPRSNSGNLFNPENRDEVDKFFKEYKEYKLHAYTPIGVDKGTTFLLDTIFTVREIFSEFYKNKSLNRNAMLAFLHIATKADSLKSIYQNKRIINQNYPFNFFIFLSYVLSFKFYIALRKKISRNKENNRYQKIDNNIYDFVITVSKD